MELQQNNKEIVNRINDGRVREIEHAYGNVEVYMARNRKHMWQKKAMWTLYEYKHSFFITWV